MAKCAPENQVSRKSRAAVKILLAVVVVVVVFSFTHIDVCNAASSEYFNEEQYKFLKECLETKDIDAWNARRETASQDRILLSGVDLRSAELWSANLQGADLKGANLQGSYLDDANLQGVDLWNADLQGANLWNANLQGTYLSSANLQGADLRFANLQGADLRFADLQGADLRFTDLQGADLSTTNLQGAYLNGANLQGAYLGSVYLTGFGPMVANLQGADFTGAALDSNTNLMDCIIDKDTNFTSTALDSVKILPETLTALKTNIRRFSWERWYEEHRIQAILVRSFWLISDYGSNMLRIIGITLAAVMFFVALYPAIIFIFNVRYFRQAYKATFGRKWFNETFCFGVKISFNSIMPFSFGRVELDVRDWEPWTFHALKFVILFNKFAGYVLFACLLTRLGILFTSLSP
jgi:uncharacterized protein YjbI with pentapeptide repeats